jgi:hypothetical protein
MRGLNKFVGADMFLSLLEFIQSFHEMYAGFKARAQRVKEILRSPDVAFLIVTSTDSAAIDEAVFFHEQLKRGGMPFGAVLVNRVRDLHLAEGDIAGLADHILAVAPPVGDRVALEHVARITEQAVHDWHVLSRVDAHRVEEVRARFAAFGDGGRVVPVRLFDHDIHDIGALALYGQIVAAALSTTA